MRQLIKPNEELEAAVGRMIDKKFVNGRLRVMAGCMLLIVLLLGGLGLLLPPPNRITLTEASVVILSAAVGCAIALLIGRAIIRRWCVAVTETRIIVRFGGMLEELALSKQAPAVVRRSTSGKYWEIAASDRPKKPLKVPYRAFPDLGQFVERNGQGTVIVEGSTGQEEKTAE